MDQRLDSKSISVSVQDILLSSLISDRFIESKTKARFSISNCKGWCTSQFHGRSYQSKPFVFLSSWKLTNCTQVSETNFFMKQE